MTTSSAEELVHKWANDFEGAYCSGVTKELIAAIAAELSTTAARYREVLEPFAKIVALYETCDDDWPIDGRWSFNYPVVTVGDLRRAAAILAQTTPQEK